MLNAYELSVSAPKTQPASGNFSRPTAKIRQMAKVHVHTFIRDYSTNQDGLAPVMLDVSIDGARWRTPVGVYLPAAQFDKDTGLVRKSFPGAADLNIIIRQALSRANEIFVRYKLSDRMLSLAQFKAEYLSSEASRSDFIRFAMDQLSKRERRGEIDELTARHGRSVFTKLQEFRKPILFQDLTPDLLEDVKAFLVHRGDEPWTVWGFFRTVKTYCNLARQKGIMFDDPFRIFKNKVPRTTREFLDQQEITSLYSCFISETTKPSHRKVLRYFLFACLTGLRISDVQRITHDNIVNGELRFIPHKGRKKKVMQSIPLTDEIRSLIVTTEGKLFETISDQKTNMALKEIAAECEIRKRLTFHVARHTFACHAINRDVNVVVLKDLLGHSKLDTTMIYAHLVNQKKKESMQKMEGMLTSSSADPV